MNPTTITITALAFIIVVLLATIIAMYYKYHEKYQDCELLQLELDELWAVHRTLKAAVNGTPPHTGGFKPATNSTTPRPLPSDIPTTKETK